MRSLSNFYRMNRTGQTQAPVAQPGRVTGPDNASHRDRAVSLAKVSEVPAVTDPLTRS